MSAYVYHWVLALAVTSPDGELLHYEKVKDIGENYVECMDARKLYDRNSWTPDKDGNTRQPMCNRDNITPLEYSNAASTEPGHYGPVPPVGNVYDSYKSTIYGPGANYYIYTHPY